MFREQRSENTDDRRDDDLNRERIGMHALNASIDHIYPRQSQADFHVPLRRLALKNRNFCYQFHSRPLSMYLISAALVSMIVTSALLSATAMHRVA